MVVGDSNKMVAVEPSTEGDDRKVLCIVRDLVDPDANAIKHTLNLQASMSVRRLINEVCKQFGYMLNTISVHYEKQEGGMVEELKLEQYKDCFLDDIMPSTVKRHNLTICELDDIKPQKMPPPPPPVGKSEASGSEDVWEHGSSSSPDKSSYFSNNTALEARPAANNVSSTSSTYSSEFTYSSVITKSDTGYVGLVNQAMTCYLNSLLQTLFMTPEFRNAIYKFHFKSDTGVKNIPYQLQRLFLLLQTSKKRAVETMDLTKSFGWDNSEVWQQHDVQELCRVMFEALEVSWKGTDQEHLINQLYQGRLKDYVKCLECSNEKAREDMYLDIPLVIRPFGSTVTYKSIQESLNAFVQPETLDGRDQYFCEKCNKKCDAHKGLKFISFPYLLTLQMKRFDFDYSTMHRIKLNDKMSFPEILNLNYLIEEVHTNAESAMSPDRENTVIESNAAKNCNDDAVDEGIEVEAGCSGSSLEEENEKNKQAEAQGPYVYELFSIMIHSGSAAGGHYYAYIKCLTDGQWYSFNDQHVSKITYDDIRKTYGGSSNSRGYYSSSYASSANAYMLMYRKKDTDRNVDFLSSEDFPDHVKEELRRLNDREEADRKQKEIDRSTCKIKIFCLHPEFKRKMEQKLEVHKDKTLLEATDLAYKMFELEQCVTRDCVRIVKYDEYQDTLECSFEGEEDTSMETLLGGVKQNYSFDLLLETRRPEQKFQQYKPGGVTVRVFIADVGGDTIEEPHISVRANLVQTVEEFKDLLIEVLGFEDTVFRIVLERFHNDLKLLTVPEKTLKAEGFFKTNKVYIDPGCPAPDREMVFDKSGFYSLLDRYQNTINILVNLPTPGEVADYKAGHYASSTGQDSAVESGVNSAENSVDNGSEMCNLPPSFHSSAERLNARGNYHAGDLEMDIKNLGLHTSLSQSDPNIYQSSSRQLDGVSKDEILQSLQNRGSRSSLECEGSRSAGSRTSRSTSTSAEFTTENISSFCDLNGDSLETGHEVLDSGKVAEALNVLSTNHVDDLNKKISVEIGCGEPANYTVVDSDSLPSASLPAAVNSLSDDGRGHVLKTGSDYIVPKTENWDEPCSGPPGCSSLGLDALSDTSTLVEPESSRKFFKAVWVSPEDSLHRSLSVMVDKRITLGAFKKELEKYVEVPANNFKVYRVYSNNQEFESIRLGETLSFLEDGKINIKLGRALKNGEYRVKVFQLLVNETEPAKFLIDTIFARGMTVLESKKLIIPELKSQLNMDIPLERLRLRKKTWKNPGSIYTDTQAYEEEIPIYPNWEVFMEVLDCDETLKSTSQLALFVRRWFPSKYELGPIEEVVLSEQSVDGLKSKISELSGLNIEDIDIAKGKGTFPYDISLLEIHNDLDWNVSVTTLSMYPLYICDDGCLVYYRDSEEKLADLSETQRKEIEVKENARSRTTQKVTYSPRKERALKIYTEENPSVSMTAESKTTTVDTATPDLD
ncbi:ubiquitin carboxyl-terminal hydrolase 47-like isoform X4 [Dreissena polymorpha]|uniref:ubiquitin carboxyl-terminal hydrolase 47-like isoform X4 n=1 Tax=Dreissena polymorpha TaxID=45954 RepID=UPI002264E36B|nr:ubiquitin carboxyl-terminal hydrolase 47-like isoform X4 [Dreissena polymorpha]